MDLQLVKTKKVTVDIYGKSFELSKPTVAQANMMRKKMKGLEEGQDIDLMIDFMSMLGMPKEIIDSLEVEHFQTLVEFVLNVKKS